MHLEVVKSLATIIHVSNTFLPIRILFQILLFFCTISIVLAVDFDDYEIADYNITNLPVSKFPDPDCKYHIRFYNRNGSQLKGKVRIGDPVYHHWTCSYKQHQNDHFCILVNNCTIANPRSDSFAVPIIDQFGCSLYPLILSHVEYNGDLEGGLETNVFLLDIDQTSITFNCNIKLLLKLDGICQRPLCPSVRHPRRL
ncbi:hypothetical protein X798_01081 [Onchocerca flexuosa]|uniref:ZP domain-containing protein n=1 Tax=Onchocerca flexuosa TaxID=387005 RepID=A0A238C4B6_9BILA|nr:hypothetical protein X798_01081 [Onchocerca flexuosa]